MKQSECFSALYISVQGFISGPVHSLTVNVGEVLIMYLHEAGNEWK